MALLILALLQRIFLMSSLMLLLVWLIFFMVLIKLLPILGTISGKTVKLMVLALISKKLFRIRMSRNFGMKMLTMTNLSTECLIQLTKLGYDATPFNQILKQNAKREMRLRLGKVTVADVLAAQPVTTNLLKFMRASIKMIGVSNLQSFI